MGLTEKSEIRKEDH